MIVEDADCLKDWVIAELSKESIDADPDAVAKYTVALVRKGPDTEEEFKPSICENLSVFLTENTESFVMRLFSVLQDKSYITQTDTTGDPNSHLVNTTSENQENTDSALSRQESAVSRQDSKAHDTDDELSDDDRDHRRTNKRSRSKSQSPSGHSQNRHRISPHRRLGYSRGSYRGGGGGYAPRSNKRGARSRLGRGNYHNDFGRRYDNGNAPPPRRRSRSPRRSASPAPRRRSRSPRRSLSPRKSPSRRSRSPLDLLSSLNPVKPSTNKTTETRQRCQDYDVQGYCLKGDLCPFSHGNDAVVMTDVTTLNFNSSSTSQPLAPVNPSSAILPNQQPVPPRPPIVEPYNPELPRMWGPNPAIRPGMHPRGSNYMMTQPRPMGGFTGMPPHALHPGPMRMGSMGPRPHQMYRPRYSANNGQPRPGTSHPPIRDPNRATLEIRNLPVEFNKIVTLHQHFEKFGTIHNIQVQYNGCPTTALVTFSANEEAKQAHQNPEPLFNNRFIKIFWYNEGGQNSDKSGKQAAAAAKPPTKNKLDAASKVGSGVPPKKARVEPNMNRATLRLDKSAQARKVSQNKRIDPKNLEQQKQIILMKLIDQQMQLLVTAEKTKDPKLKSEILKELRKQEINIKEMKESLKLSQAASKSASAKAAKTTKEILDAEIDVHQKKLAGEDTAELQQKLESLKKHASSLGIVDSRGRGGTRGGRGRGRGGGAFKHAEQAPPPTALTILGFKPEEKDAVVAHFKQYGTVTPKEYREGPMTSIVVEYSKAHDAKVASIHGAKFGSKNLIMKWYKPAPTTPPAPSPSQTPTTSVAPVLSSTASSQSAPSKSTAEVALKPPTASAPSDSADSTVQEVRPAVSDSVLLDNNDETDILATDDCNEVGDIDEDILLDDEDFGDDSDKKRVWLP